MPRLRGLKHPVQVLDVGWLAQHYHPPIEGIETAVRVCVIDRFDAPSITMPRLRGLKPNAAQYLARRTSSQHYHAPIEGIETFDLILKLQFLFAQHYHAPIEGIETWITFACAAVRSAPSITMPRLRGLKLIVIANLLFRFSYFPSITMPRLREG